MIGYASPSLVTLAGRRQIVITAEATIMGFDATSGETLWTWSRPGQASGMANTSQLRQVSDTELLSTKGYPDGGGQLLRFVTADNGKITPERVWQEGRVLKTKLTSAYLYDGHAYALTNGFLECTRVSDGKRQWKQRGRFGHGQMLVIGGKLLLHSEGADRTAKLYLLEASPDGYKELGSFETINGVCWNTLCLYGSKLLVRSEQEAACIELPIVKSRP
jgi:outer membrane protein assembly factor BamB